MIIMATKDGIFEYVMNNPENTNPNILRDMLDNLNNGGGTEGVPPYTLSDENKVLTVEKVENGSSTVTVVQSQSVTLAQTKDVILSSGTVDFSALSDGDSVDVYINDALINCTFHVVDGAEMITGTGVVIESTKVGYFVTYDGGTAGETYTISATASVTAYKAQAGWKAASGGSSAPYIINVELQQISGDLVLVVTNDGNDIYNAIMSGKCIYISMPVEQGDPSVFLTVDSINVDERMLIIRASEVIPSSNSLTFYTYSISWYGESVSISPHEYSYNFQS